MLQTTATAIQSVRCTIGLRLRGATAGLVTCEGRIPRIAAGGTVVVGRLALRAPRVPVFLGATVGGALEIGERVFINEGAQVVAAHRITIGADCRIGDFVAIHDSDFHPIDEHSSTRRAPVVIGRNVWIARGAIILPGVTIGDHAVIGAGAIVTTDVPDRTLVAGNPARVIRSLSASAEWRRP